jgi:tRNA-dihydrouridine synthase
LANGSLSCWQDVCDCLEYTKADGVMSSEAILEYPPALYYPSAGPSMIGVDRPCRPGPGRLAIAREYLELCRAFPPEHGNGASGMQCLQMHMNTFLHADLEDRNKDESYINNNEELRSAIMNSHSLEDLFQCLQQIKNHHQQLKHEVNEEQMTWYFRHR